MKLLLSFSKSLLHLKEGRSISYGAIKGKSRDVLHQFVNDGVLEIVHIGLQQKKVRCSNHVNLDSYLHHKFEIPDLATYISFLETEVTHRSDAVKAASNSKYRNTKVFRGIMINAYNEIDCTLRGKPFRVKPMHGSFTFIYDLDHFKIPVNITVVGVEGHENFREIERQKYLFTNMKPLFVWRYQNSIAIAEWLSHIPNQYLHYGDFDPKGIHIYGSEFRNKIGKDRCRFLIPSNLDMLMAKYGERELFEKQINYLHLIDHDDYAEVDDLIRIINKYKKGLAQEILID